MYYINLSQGFNPYGANAHQLVDFEQFTFPGGEPHIKILSQNLANKHLTISIRINQFADLGRLMVAVDALKRMDIRSFDLFLPYFPGARQDRVMVPGEPLTAKVYTSLINQLGAHQVTLYDPHSEVVPALLDRCQVLDNGEFVKQCLAEIGQPVKLVAPDGGALKKVYRLSQQLNGLPIVQCSKRRDVWTGALSGFDVHAKDLQGQACLVVDDICDGGGTFVGLAEKLKEKGAGPLFLAISHGIFSKGLSRLKAHFDHIFTTDSIAEMANEEAFTQIPLLLSANTHLSRTDHLAEAEALTD